MSTTPDDVTAAPTAAPAEPAVTPEAASAPAPATEPAPTPSPVAGEPTGPDSTAPAPAGVTPSPRSRVARRLLDQPLRRLGLGGTIVVLGVSAAFGGLAPADVDAEVQELVLETTVTAPPFELRIDRVVTVADLEGMFEVDDTNRWVGLVGTVTNTHHTTVESALLRQALRLADLDGPVEEPDDDGRLAPTAIRVLADDSELSYLQPNLDYEVVWLWEQSGEVERPVEVDVVVLDHTWRADSIDQVMKWKDPRLTMGATIAVEDLDEAGS